MITIDQSSCNLCGLCIRICHEHCIAITDGLLQIDHQYCSTCCQCIAVCPSKVLSWDNHQPTSFDRNQYPAPAQIGELFRERRTCRDFSDKPIDRALLEQIVSIAICSPTHNYNLRIIIIDDPKIIEKVDTIILRFVKQLYYWVHKPQWIKTLVKLVAPSSEYEYLKAKPKLEFSIKRGRALKTVPAAIILVVGEKRVPLSLESAQYALYTMDLYAQTLKLGCRNLVGNQMILNRSKSLRKTLKIKSSEKIFGTIALGYPAVKFTNKITGKQIRMQWN